METDVHVSEQVVPMLRAAPAKSRRPKSDTMSTIRRRVAAKISRMTKDEARAALDAIGNEHKGPGATIFHAVIRDLTGGYNSQSINSQVIRALGIKAGIIKGR